MEKQTKKWFFVDLHGFTGGILLREIRKPIVVFATDDELVAYKFNDDYLAGMRNGNCFINIKELRPDGKQQSRWDLESIIKDQAKKQS